MKIFKKLFATYRTGGKMGLPAFDDFIGYAKAKYEPGRLSSVVFQNCLYYLKQLRY